MIAPTYRMPAHMRRVMTPSLRGRGGSVITSASAGSTPSASAGAPSVTRLIHRICVARSGSTTPLPASTASRHFVELGAHDGPPVFNDAEFFGDNGCRFRMVARYHHRTYPCRFGPTDGLLCLLTRGIDDADQSRKHEILLDPLIDFITF